MRYLVQSLFLDQWIEHGSVLLPPGASYQQVEAALSAVGVYAPRGGDELDWVVPFGAPKQIFSALIFDMHGEVIVKLTAVEQKKKAAR